MRSLYCNFYYGNLHYFVILNTVDVIVATASTCNVILMRYNELFEGIEVCDQVGRTVGTSKEAAKKVSILT